MDIERWPWHRRKYGITLFEITCPAETITYHLWPFFALCEFPEAAHRALLIVHFTFNQNQRLVLKDANDCRLSVKQDIVCHLSTRLEYGLLFELGPSRISENLEPLPPLILGITMLLSSPRHQTQAHHRRQRIHAMIRVHKIGSL